MIRHNFIVGIIVLFLTAVFPGCSSRELLTPPNGVHLKDNLFIDQTEIANIHYLEFLHHVKRDSSEEVYERLQPYLSYYSWKVSDSAILLPDPDSASFYADSLDIDTSLIGEYDKFKHSGYKDNYLDYPGFRYFPVVGITYYQAQMYCKWRSKVVTEQVNDLAPDSTTSKRYYFKYRLPTPEEWELAASAGLDTNEHPYGYKKAWMNYDSITLNHIAYWNPDLKKKEHQEILNDVQENERPVFVSEYYFPSELIPELIPELIRDSDAKLYKENYNFLSYIYSNAPNSNGLYHMTGNVAEMTSEKGVAKGGSWKHNPEECKISQKQSYSCPQTWLGFRCICEVYTYHKDSGFQVPDPIKPVPSKNDTCYLIRKHNYERLRERRKKDTGYIREQLLNIQETPDSGMKVQLKINKKTIPENAVLKNVLDSINKFHYHLERKDKSVEVDTIQQYFMIYTGDYIDDHSYRPVTRQTKDFRDSGNGKTSTPFNTGIKYRVLHSGYPSAAFVIKVIGTYQKEGEQKSFENLFSRALW